MKKLLTLVASAVFAITSVVAVAQTDKKLTEKKAEPKHEAASKKAEEKHEKSATPAKKEGKPEQK